MAESQSLLAHLTPWFYQPIEDRGTDALAYVLNSYQDCRTALKELLQDADNPLPPIAKVTTQVIDDLQSRPDMIGCDEPGERRIIAEVKFWAIMQPDQAGRYYEKLAESGPGLLLFICPEQRIHDLWGEVEGQLRNREPSILLGTVVETEGMRRAPVSDKDRSVVMVSWRLLLNHLANAATDFEAQSDIHQLRGLVRHQNTQAFQPIDTDAPAAALLRRETKLRRLIADAKRTGLDEDWLSTEGLAGGGRRRYFSIKGASPPWLTLEIRDGERFDRTPIWVGVRNEDWKDRDLPEGAVKWRTYSYLPVNLRFGLDDQSLLSLVVRQLREIADLVREACPE